MPYADTDFFLALIKPSDWLKANALSLSMEHKGALRTSVATLIELLLVAPRYDLDVLEIVSAVAEYADIPPQEGAIATRAAQLMATNGLNTFDAFHAAAAGKQRIISSDKAFDRAGLDRIPLDVAA